MSSFLPNIVVVKAMKDLKLESTIHTPDLDKKIRAGLDWRRSVRRPSEHGVVGTAESGAIDDDALKD